MNAECPAEVRECPHLQASAEIAVKRVFSILGVDIDKPDQVEAFRENLRFGARLRKAADHGELVLVAAIVGAALLALWTGIKATITGGP